MKGDKFNECNRKSCSTQEATWYNKSTRKFYCKKCAFEIMEDPYNHNLLVDEANIHEDAERAVKRRQAEIYDHLNEKELFSLEINFDDLAKKVVKMNYGAKRFLATLARELDKRNQECEQKDSPISDAIYEVLGRGHFY